MLEASGEILILTTVSSLEQAEAFGRALVESRLAACATVLPGAMSFYRWQTDEVNRDSETVILIKSHLSRLEAMREHFARSHPYECPEFLVFPAAYITEAYQKWLHSELRLEGNP